MVRHHHVIARRAHARLPSLPQAAARLPIEPTMPHGGKRAGAGRKPGADWAGTKPPPVRDLAKSRVREILTTAQDPLAVLVEIAADQEQNVQVRLQAAQAACPYLYPRLSQSVVASLSVASSEPQAAIVDRLMSRIARMVPTIEAQPERQEVTA